MATMVKPHSEKDDVGDYTPRAHLGSAKFEAG
jgi:hypothetical protein